MEQISLSILQILVVTHTHDCSDSFRRVTKEGSHCTSSAEACTVRANHHVSKLFAAADNVHGSLRNNRASTRFDVFLGAIGQSVALHLPRLPLRRDCFSICSIERRLGRRDQFSDEYDPTCNQPALLLNMWTLSHEKGRT
eukprot:1008106-Amphidinium_carterae.1